MRRARRPRARSLTMSTAPSAFSRFQSCRSFFAVAPERLRSDSPDEERPRVLGELQHLSAPRPQRRDHRRSRRVAVEQLELDHLRQRRRRSRSHRGRPASRRRHGPDRSPGSTRTHSRRAGREERGQNGAMRRSRSAQKPTSLRASPSPDHACSTWMCAKSVAATARERCRMHEHVRRGARAERFERFGHGRIGRADVDGNHALACRPCAVCRTLRLPPG